MKTSGWSLERSESAKRRRERWTIFFLVLLLVALTIFEIRLSRLSSSLPFVTSIFFFGLINFNVVLLMIIIFLIFRNVGKLFIERRRRLFGSKLKTKLVLSFLSFSLIPTFLLFAISAFYINSSFDKWFSIKIGNTLQNSLEITDVYYSDARDKAAHFAKLLKEEVKSTPTPLESPDQVEAFLKEKAAFYAMDGIELYQGPFEPRLEHISGSLNQGYLPRLSVEIFEKVSQGEGMIVIHRLEHGDAVRSVLPVEWPEALAEHSEPSSNKGVLSVTQFVPLTLANKVDQIAGAIDDYREVNPLKYPVKTIYFVILVMMTLLIAFVAIWVGLFLAKELTNPIERLATATHAIAAGNLDHKIPNPGNDEISRLIQSFNKMTEDLKSNRIKLDAAHTDLVSTNKDLEGEKLYIETLLKNLQAGVMSVNREGRLATMNRSAEELLEVEFQQYKGQTAEAFLPQELNQFLSEAEGRSKQGFFSLQNKKDSTVKNVVVRLTRLDQEGDSGGWVMVFEDVTNLVKAQREAAWREVARRIAHEIKNPLTPIKLSAQRLRKRFLNQVQEGNEVFDECTNTIINQVDGLKDMVNEFSAFARFPSANPVKQDFNALIEEVGRFYEEAHKNTKIEFRLDEKLPAVEFDREQFRRVIVNLLENALSAIDHEIQQRPAKVLLETRFDQSLQMVKFKISDNGPGIPDELKERIFEPYYTTKKKGSGLGLAIVSKVVSDHSGFIRLAKSELGGTAFLIELPLDAGLAHPPSDKIDNSPLIGELG